MSTAARRYNELRVRKLKEMAGRGFPASAIAVELNKLPPLNLPVSAESVRKKCIAIGGIRLRRPAARLCSEVKFPILGEIWPKLVKRANARGLSVSQLCRLIVEVVIDENLLTAIIDEYRPRRRKRRPDSAPRIGRPTAPR